jgi:hypothetical protein
MHSPWRGFVAVAACAFALTGCQARAKYKPLAQDSTGVAPDSIVATMTAAQQSWDSGSPDDAARMSAAAMLADLRMHPVAEWQARARALLDSLVIGGEVGSGSDGAGAILVNLFSRSDPDRGSWPYLFWSGPKGPRMQAIEGRDLAWESMATLPPNGPPAIVALLFTRRGAVGGQPLAMAWKAGAGGTFSLMQTLGADSLGGAGTGEFATVDTTLELHTRTFRASKLFTECATCPHVYTLHRFQWTPAGFRRVSDDLVASPYATFVRFVQAVAANDRDAAKDEITSGDVWEQARRLGWDQPHGTWRVAPSTDETAREMVFTRGASEAYRVTFIERDATWRISGIESTTEPAE